MPPKNIIEQAKEDREEQVKVSILEMIRLNEIRLRHKGMQLGIADSVISLFKRISTLTPDTSLEELKEAQSQLRAMINETDQEFSIIKDDKEFVEMLMNRSKKNKKSALSKCKEENECQTKN